MEERLSMSLQHCSPEVLQLATNFAADYLDYLENLPFDLQRSVTKLREIDMKCREYVAEIETLYESFIKSKENDTNLKHRSCLLKIQRLFTQCKELGDEKIAIVQSMNEIIEGRNKQLELGSKRFRHAYEPSGRSDHHGRKERDSKLDSGKNAKRPRRQRNQNSCEKMEKSLQSYKDQEKIQRDPSYVEEVERPKVLTINPVSQSNNSSAAAAVSNSTRSSQREDEKRLVSKSVKEKKEERKDKSEKEEVVDSTSLSSGKSSLELAAASLSSSAAMSPTTSISTAVKQASNGGAASLSASIHKNNIKGKKKKRKSNKHQTERQASNSGDVSPLVEIPIDPDEPTYCLCQQVSFGQMIGCDNPKCPIEWFHFSCLRLSHKPKGKWYCPDCLAKMKEKKRESKRGDHR